MRGGRFATLLVIGCWLLGRKTTSDHQQPTTNNQQLRAITSGLAVALLVPITLHACPVCFGDPNSPLVKGANNGVWVLLGIIAFVQIGFVALFISFWKRAKQLRAKREQFRLIEGGAR